MTSSRTTKLKANQKSGITSHARSPKLAVENNLPCEDLPYCAVLILQVVAPSIGRRIVQHAW
jgi:hypothetical protein